jgi:phosphoglycerate dehydrogenase-like enzyme
MANVDVLLFEKSHARIADALATRCPDARAVVWHADGTLSVNGETVTAGDVTPVAGWVSGDVLRAKVMVPYAQALIDTGPVAWAQSVNAGLDYPIYADLARAGVALSKSGAQSIPIAEFVLGYALHHSQDIALREAAQQAGEWKPHRFAELWHSRWLIVGYGHIGRNVAKRASAFDAHVTVARRTQGAVPFVDAVIPPEDILSELANTDVVVLACPATDATRGMANQAFFAAMKPDALLVNVARGSLVDEAALVTALDAGKPGRAVLDVFVEEPLPASSPLWGHERVTVTAHISNAGGGTPGRGDELFLSNLERFLAGQAPEDQVAASDILAG